MDQALMPHDSERAAMLTQRQRRAAAKRMTVDPRQRSAGLVVCYPRGEHCNASNHEWVTRVEIAKKLAALKRYEFGGEYDPDMRYQRPLYFVPGSTVIGNSVADTLG